MKTRIAILVAVAALLLLGSAALAWSDVRAPIAASNVQATTQTYHLTSQTWQVSGTASGDGFQLVSVTAPALNGSGCCCTYLPFICR
jgi:hypothetical protein